MREQKFRVWDKVDKRYYNNVDIEDIGRVLFLLKDYGHEYIIEQYTGLKDKNGKPIYQGDIVKINGWWDAAGPAGYDENLCVVEWYKAITGFVPFNDYDCDCGVYHHAEECEIIGNIHENPDLLGEEK